MFVVKRWRKMPRGRRYPLEMAGMLVAHFGIAVFLAGVFLSESLSVQRNVALTPGQSGTAGNYVFQLDGIKHVEGPNWTAEQGKITVFNQSGEQVAVLHPQKRTYPRGTVQTEASVDAGFITDLYASLGNPLSASKADGGTGAWSVRIYSKPFVRWIWAGGLFMMIGGFTAAADKRFRIKKTVADEAVPDTSLPLPEDGKGAEASA